MIRSSERMAAVQEAVIPTINALVSQTPGTISLGQGVSGFGPPAVALERMNDFAAFSYVSGDGLPELTDAIRTKLENENGIDMCGRRLQVTAGSNQAFTNLITVITQPGDEVILISPYYFNNHMAIVMASCIPVLVRTDAESGYVPDVADIEAAITERTKAVVTISPNNPTGAVYPPATLRAINALCAAKHVYHIVDECYEYFMYGSEHLSAAAIPGSAQHTIATWSLSKCFGFAGWRVGYVLYPERLMPDMRKVQDTIAICAPVPSQHVAVGCLKAGREWFCREKLPELEAVRSIVLRRLGAPEHQLLWRVCGGMGAFFVMVVVLPNPAVAAAQDSMTLAQRLITEHKVACVPGIAFGTAEGAGIGCQLRVAYGALEKTTVTEGADRLAAGLTAILSETTNK